MNRSRLALALLSFAIGCESAPPLRAPRISAPPVSNESKGPPALAAPPASEAAPAAVAPGEAPSEPFEEESGAPADDPKNEVVPPFVEADGGETVGVDAGSVDDAAIDPRGAQVPEVVVLRSELYATMIGREGAVVRVISLVTVGEAPIALGTKALLSAKVAADSRRDSPWLPIADVVVAAVDAAAHLELTVVADRRSAEEAEVAPWTKGTPVMLRIDRSEAAPAPKPPPPSEAGEAHRERIRPREAHDASERTALPCNGRKPAAAARSL